MSLNRLSRTGTANRPFYIACAGVNIWSTEELCFFLSRNLALIDEEIAGTRLTRWLTEEFRLTSLSIRMEQALRSGRLADFLLPLFQETGYLTAPEMRDLSARLGALESAPAPARFLMKADALCENHMYGEAIAFYHRAEENGGTGEEERSFRSRCAAGCGVAAARMLEYGEALKEFRRALELEETRSNLRNYLTALRLVKPAESFAKEAEEAGADDEMLRGIDEAIFRAMEKETEEPADLRRAVAGLRERYHAESGS